MCKFQYLPIFIAFLSFNTLVQGQQIPFLNHYTWNPRLFNPAGQGLDNTGEITAVYRSQFQSLDAADRPNTYLFHADLSPWLPERIGLAAQVIGDKAHLISRFQFSGLFGYHLLRGPKLRFSLGAAASVLTQNIDFDGLRLSDILDLSVFEGQVNNTQFDGGPGLALEYHTPSGSFFALDMAATQLFTSDVRINGVPNNTRKGAIYDMVPHYLANARIHLKGNGFAIEPTLAFRALGGQRPLKTGVFDLNLNSYFLKDNRLMLGAGMRTNQGGWHFQLGIKPTNTLCILASAELHTALGTSYEFGASYTFGKSVTPSAPSLSNLPTYENLLVEISQQVNTLSATLTSEADSLQKEQVATREAMVGAAATGNRKQQLIGADDCIVQLARNGSKLERIQQMAQSLEVLRLQAEQVVRRATSQGAMGDPATLQTLKTIQEHSLNVQERIQGLVKVRQELLRQCANLRPETSVAACLRSGDVSCMEEILNTELAAVQDRPGNMYPLRVFTASNAAVITYHFPNDEERYLLNKEQQALARHLVQEVRNLQGEGVTLDKILLVSELQEDRSTLDYRLSLQYSGELDSLPIPYSLVDGETGTTENQQLLISTGSRVSLESLSVLKLSAWRKFLTEQGIPANRIALEVRYNYASNIYREETKMILQVRQ